jgi:hypothetical protein
LLKSSDVFQFELQSDNNKGKGHPTSRLCRQNRSGITAPSHSQPRRSKRVGGQHYAPAALLPEKTSYPLYRRQGGPQGRSSLTQKISPPPGDDPRTVQPVASRYAVHGIPAASDNNNRHSEDLSVDDSFYERLA